MPENTPPSGTREAVAREIRLALDREKMSERALADAIGMPQSNFSRRMTGAVAFSIDELAAVAATLKLPLAWLVTPDASSAGAA